MTPHHSDTSMLNHFLRAHREHPVKHDTPDQAFDRAFVSSINPSLRSMKI
jgi:hypothetical protein